MSQATPVTLLVVDDHAAFRGTIRQMFDRESTVILEATSGEEAVDRFAEARPDWVLMDLRMAGMGGIKATQAIRKLDPKARVIVISQFTEAEFRDQALAAGAMEFVSKENMSQLAGIILGSSLES